MMPVYKGVPVSEQSAELQSTEAYKGCQGAASGADNVIMQIININNCLGDACESGK